MPATLEKPKLSGDTKAAVIDLLYRLADDALIIGHRNSEWTGIGPILEEDIAFSSMAQDKMGHASFLYGMLHELGESEPNVLAFGRKPERYRCCSLVVLECLSSGDGAEPPLSNNPVRDTLLSRGDWAMSLVRQFLFSEADALRWAALEQSAYVPLAQFAKKLRGELKYHTMHGRLMMEKLSRATPESCDRLQAALDVLYPHALGMFEPTRFDMALAEEGICPSEAEQCKTWEADIAAILGRCGMKAPRGTKPVHGGRQGKHPPEMRDVLDALQKVYRLDPTAQW